MSRPSHRARWARCALALAAITSLATTAAADRKKKVKKPTKTPVSVCAHFDQIDKEDDGVDLVVANRCEVKLTCSVSWRLTCAPDTRKATRTQRASAFELDLNSDQSTLASPGECGNDGWMIDDVVWSCQPQPEPPAR
jgi:hypothetical protein